MMADRAAPDKPWFALGAVPPESGPRWAPAVDPLSPDGTGRSCLDVVNERRCACAPAMEPRAAAFNTAAELAGLSLRLASARPVVLDVRWPGSWAVRRRLRLVLPAQSPGPFTRPRRRASPPLHVLASPDATCCLRPRSRLPCGPPGERVRSSRRPRRLALHCRRPRLVVPALGWARRRPGRPRRGLARLAGGRRRQPRLARSASSSATSSSSWGGRCRRRRRRGGADRGDGVLRARLRHPLPRRGRDDGTSSPATSPAPDLFRPPSYGRRPLPACRTARRALRGNGSRGAGGRGGGGWRRRRRGSYCGSGLRRSYVAPAASAAPRRTRPSTRGFVDEWITDSACPSTPGARPPRGGGGAATACGEWRGGRGHKARGRRFGG